MFFKIKLLIDERARGGSLRRTPPASPWDVAAGALPRVAPAIPPPTEGTRGRSATSVGRVRRGRHRWGPCPRLTSGRASDTPDRPSTIRPRCGATEGVLPSSKKQSTSRSWGALFRGPSVPNRPASTGLGLPRDRRPLPFSPLDRCRRLRPPLPRGTSCSTTRTGATRASSLVAWYRAALWATAKR